MAKLTARNLSHRFGPVCVLDEINFSLQQGQVMSVVGPSGCGKSTLLKLCASLLTVESGLIENTFQRCSFAFQEPRLLPWKTTLENIAFGLKARGLERQQRLKLASEIGLRFGLQLADLHKFPKDLSGGMRQRVSFARALLTKPDILFLDEPFSALDIGLKQELQNILIKEIECSHLAVFFITHDLMEAVKLSDRILLLGGHPGKIVQQFDLQVVRELRDTSYVYQQTADLLSHPDIIETFELPQQEQTPC